MPPKNYMSNYFFFFQFFWVNANPNLKIYCWKFENFVLFTLKSSFSNEKCVNKKKRNLKNFIPVFGKLTVWRWLRRRGGDVGGHFTFTSRFWFSVYVIIKFKKKFISNHKNLQKLNTNVYACVIFFLFLNLFFFPEISYLTQ